MTGKEALQKTIKKFKEALRYILAEDYEAALREANAQCEICNIAEKASEIYACSHCLMRELGYQTCEDFADSAYFYLVRVLKGDRHVSAEQLCTAIIKELETLNYEIDETYHWRKAE